MTPNGGRCPGEMLRLWRYSEGEGRDKVKACVVPIELRGGIQRRRSMSLECDSTKVELNGSPSVYPLIENEALRKQ